MVMNPKVKALVQQLIRPDSSPADSRYAAQQLGKIGRNAAEALPALMQALTLPAAKEINTVLEVFGALEKITEGATMSEGAVKELSERLVAYAKAHPDKADRAGSVLGRMGPSVLDLALDLSTSKSAALRKCGTYAIFHYPSEHRAGAAARVIPALAAQLESRPSEALFAVSTWYEHAAPLAAKLGELLATGGLDTVTESIELLGRIGPEARAAAPRIAKVLAGAKKGDQHEELVTACVSALQVLAQPGTPGVVKALRHAAEIGEFFTADSAAKLLVTFAAAAVEKGESIEPYAELLVSGAAGGDGNAIELLEKLGDRGLAIAHDAAISKNEEQRVSGLSSLGRLGKAAVKHMGTIVKALTDKSEEARSAAARALTGFGSEAVEPLAQALHDATTAVAAAEALASLGPTVAKSAQEALVRALGSAVEDEARSKIRNALAIVAPERVPGARVSPKLARELAIAVDARIHEGERVWPSPLAYFDTMSPPEELLRFWAYSLEHEDAVPSGLELRTELSGIEAAWFKEGGRAAQVRTFALDQRHGQYAVWLVKKDPDACPIVFLGDEGDSAIVAESMADFLDVLAVGHQDVGAYVAGGLKNAREFGKTPAAALKTYRAWLKSTLKRDPVPKVMPVMAADLPKLETLVG